MRKISLDCLVFAARSHGTGPRRKSVWRWLGIGVLSFAVLALFAPASWAQTVTVEVTTMGTAVPGGTVDLEATAKVDDVVTPIQSISWTQIGGVTATISSPDANPTTVTLGADSAYKGELVNVLSEPPIGPEQLPPNVPVPDDEEFPAGLQNRFQIMPANPFALEEAGLVKVHVEVTTSEGDAMADVDIHTELPWKVKGEVRNVAIGIPVLLQGKAQASYDWALYRRPWESTATLTDATSQYPEFTPDIRGEYVVTVTDMATGKMVQLEIYAGTWVGVITGQDEADGRPLAQNCTPCHREAGRAPDIFTPWRQTGHAEIFTDNLNTSTHYSESCFACHTVGFDKDVFNYGADDDIRNYQGFLDADLLNNPSPDNWTMVLTDFPLFARTANIQCENCHGPQSSQGHNRKYSPDGVTGLDPRVDISSNICGVCHGEPLRHARFQQWQLSLHADYELATERSTSSNCSRCHTANGFLTWVPVLLGEVPGDPTDDITVNWTEDKSHPQTCPTCHDPHQIGTTTGNETNATVRISDETPLLVAGFQASNVGRGAICMTCHNTRRGLFNDNTPLAESDRSRAPHVGVQADIVMGQNAFFVNLGANGPEGFPPGLPAPGHSNQTAIPPEFGSVPDTCASCHMVATPPPEDLAYNQGGTNHTFFAAEDICSTCHPAGDPCVVGGGDCTHDDVETPILAKLATLENLIVEGIKVLMNEQIKEGNTIDLGGEATITDVAQIAEMELDESHGRLAITVTLTDTSVVGPVSMADVEVVDSGDNVLGSLYDDSPAYDDLPAYDGLTAPDTLGRAGWNYLLVHGDASHGVHNYNFEITALNNAIAAIEPLAPAAAVARYPRWRSAPGGSVSQSSNSHRG